MRAIALLSAMKFKNSLRTLFTDPRKLIPTLLILIFAGTYIALVSFGLNKAAGTKPPGPAMLDGGIIKSGVFLIIVIISFAVIDVGLGDTLLAFSLPDVDYVFPSPISRRIVLAYKLPSLTFSSLLNGFLVLFLVSMMRGATGPLTGQSPDASVPSWAPPLAMFLCIGFFMNLAMYISVTVNNRKIYHRVLAVTVITMLIGIVAFGGLMGVNAVVNFANSAWMRAIFFVPNFAATVVNRIQPIGPPLGWLALCYVLSLIPMFASNANYYEQSIVSTERVSAIRKAAKGGYASLMAANAAKYKDKTFKAYTVSPFGAGPMALVWAHLCAAAKKPFPNFIGPFLAGVVLGSLSGIAATNIAAMGYGVLGFMAMYSALFFLGTAKTASENAIRRRELMSPLPIKAWQSVAANLGVPMVAVLLLGVGIAVPLMVIHPQSWPVAVAAIIVVFPIFIATRMVLQYIIVLGYPDVADKVQQFLAMGVFQVFAGPLLLADALFCVPAFLFKSPWAAVIGLTLFEVPALALLLALAGRASEKAVASGEPVSLWKMLMEKI